MLNNSYDAGGFHFGIATSTRLQELENVSGGPVYNPEDEEKIMDVLETSELVDFSNIDGLTVEEITRCNPQNSNIILFVMWEAIRIQAPERATTLESKNISYKMIFQKDKWNKDRPFDDVVEEHLLTLYPRYSSGLQKRAKGFLQRYRYGSKEETDKALQKIIYIK